MNHEEIIAKMKALTEDIKSREGQLTEDDLGSFMAEVQQSLNEVFTLAQGEINRGIQQIEQAQQTLLDQDMAQEAATIAPLLDNMHSVQHQLDIGMDVSQRKRDLQPYDHTPHPERVLTRELLLNLSGLEKALKRRSQA